MVLFDDAEYQRWATTAERDLAMARPLQEWGFHEGAVHHAEQAAQCWLKALLHGVGEKQRARGHSLLSSRPRRRKLAGLDLAQERREALAALSASHQSARYPDALPDGTPADHYGPAAAGAAVATAEHVGEAVAAAQRCLAVAVAVDEDEDEDEDGT